MDINVDMHFLFSGIKLFYFKNSVNSIAEKLGDLSVKYSKDKKSASYRNYHSTS